MTLFMKLRTEKVENYKQSPNLVVSDFNSEKYFAWNHFPVTLSRKNQLKFFLQIVSLLRISKQGHIESRGTILLLQGRKKRRVSLSKEVILQF